jgi:drug/metabolite transporter (DMT)-like permease
MILFGFLHAFIITGYFIAIKHINISTAVLLLYTSSIWMVLFGAIILKEKIKVSSIIALIISIAGVVLIISPKQIIFGENLFGIIAALLAGVGFGLVYVLSKTFKEYDKVSLTFWQNLLALPFVVPLLFIEPINFTLKNGILVFILGIITLIAFIITYNGLEKVKSHIASVVILADMLFPIILALILFKEVPGIYTIIGGVLIIGGILIVSLKN